MATEHQTEFRTALDRLKNRQAECARDNCSSPAGFVGAVGPLCDVHASECARDGCDDPAACMTPDGRLCDKHADELAEEWDE